MDLDQASAFSHYARRVLDANSSWAGELAATLDAPFDWACARTAIDAATAAPDATGTLGAALRALRTRVMVCLLYTSDAADE